MFERISRNTVIIIDEVDRIEGEETTKRLADTIKTLSDYAVATTLILVGVGDSVDDLIKEHLSVERALVQIQMPRMSPEELFEIIDKGVAIAKMTIDADARRQVVKLSEGLPHYTHLLGLHAAEAAIKKESTNITKEDVNKALDVALEQAQQSIVRGYHKATSSPRGNLYPQVLLACALAPVDELGYFSSADVRKPMSYIMKKLYDIPAFSRHLNDFCEEDRGPVLEKTGYPRRYKFRFKNPLMEPYVIMQGLSGELIKEEDLNKF
jgi:Cdc6-like AAA superfamily ATPase